jgi:Flp pilus assembly protein TadD
VAAAAVAWLAVGLRNELLLDRAQEVSLRADPSPEEIEAALADSRDGELLNPDWAEPEGLRATLRIRTGDERAAHASLTEIVRREPDNVQAWALLALVSRRIDPPLATRAARRVRELDPVNARRRP